MKDYIAFFSFFLFGCIAVPAQNCPIQKGYAYSKTSNPGTVFADDAGNIQTPAVQTLHVVYLEVKGKEKPGIEEVIVKDKVYTAAIYPVTTVPEEVGRKEPNGPSITIEPKRGNSLWKVELTPADSKRSGAKKKLSNEVTVRGRKGKNTYAFTIQKEIKLQPDLRY